MLSIRAKLTFWYLAVAAAVLLAFAVAIYVYLSRGLLATIDTSLWHQADRIAQAVGYPSMTEETSPPAVLMLAPQFVSIVNQQGRVTDQYLCRRPQGAVAMRRSPCRARMASASKHRLAHKQARVLTWPAKERRRDFFVSLGNAQSFSSTTPIALLLRSQILWPLARILRRLVLANKALKPVDRSRDRARYGVAP